MPQLPPVVLGTLLASLLMPAVAAAVEQRLIAPAVGEPVPTGIGLATYCEGDPATATWKAWSETLEDDEVRNGPDGGNSCYLPWLGPSPSVLGPWSDADGYVSLNLTGMWCGEEPSAAERTAFGDPRFLYLQLPPEPRPIAQRGYMVSVRIMQGTPFPTDAEPAPPPHWGPWRRIRDEKLGGNGQIVALPFGELRVDHAPWFQVQIYLLDGNRTYGVRVVDFVSPVDC